MTHTEDEKAVPCGRSIHRFIPCIVPATTHNALEIHYGRGGNPHIGKTHQLQEAEAYLEARMAPLVSAVGGVPLCGALVAQFTWIFAADARHAIGDAKTTKPDLSNLVKTLEDVLVRLGVIADDALICDERLMKGYGRPGIYVALTELEGTGA